MNVKLAICKTRSIRKWRNRSLRHTFEKEEEKNEMNGWFPSERQISSFLHNFDLFIDHFFVQKTLTINKSSEWNSFRIFKIQLTSLFRFFHKIWNFFVLESINIFSILVVQVVVSFILFFFCFTSRFNCVHLLFSFLVI